MDNFEMEISPALREKLEHYSRLHDFYGPLLTERQNTCFTMHYLEDLSLSEAGEALGISPQAVADQVKRSLKLLRRFEDKLGFISSWERRQASYSKILTSDISTEETRLIIKELQVND